jgi:hypothetical protein
LSARVEEQLPFRMEGTALAGVHDAGARSVTKLKKCRSHLKIRKVPKELGAQISWISSVRGNLAPNGDGGEIGK